MNNILFVALMAFAAAGVFQGLRVRRGSFLAGLALRSTDADRQAGGWLAAQLLRSPRLCGAVEAASQILPGPREGVEGVVTGSTTFTYLQSRTILHRYYRWQVHNIVRVLLALLFCGVVVAAVASGELTSGGYSMVAAGSGVLCAYALASWWTMRGDCEGTRRCCRNAAEEGDRVLDAFGELSRSALHQAVAFGLVFALNIGSQVLQLVDARDFMTQRTDAELIQEMRLEAAESSSLPG